MTELGGSRRTRGAWATCPCTATCYKPCYPLRQLIVYPVYLLLIQYEPSRRWPRRAWPHSRRDFRMGEHLQFHLRGVLQVRRIPPSCSRDLLAPLRKVAWAAPSGLTVAATVHSNALTLEQLMRAHPHSGSLITFAQFLSIAVQGLPRFVTVARVRGVPVPWLRKRKIPLAPYLVQVSLFYAISLLNNRAFGYKIPMPVHIIFRSGGLVVSMVMGWAFAGKR